MPEAQIITGTLITTILIYGLIKAIVLALISEGFSLIFGVAKTIDVAYGAWYMLMGYIIFTLVGRLKVLDVYSSTIIGAVSLFVIGIAYYYGVNRRMRGDHLDFLLASFLLALILQNLIKWLFTDFPWSIPTHISGSTLVLGVSVFNQQILAVITSIVLLMTLWWLIYRTKLGMAIRAVAQDPVAAMLMGVNPDRVLSITIGISVMLAGLAGALVSPVEHINPYMGWEALTFAFAIVVLGGLGDFRGALVASFIIAYVEVAVLNLVSTLLAGAASLAAIVLVLWFRPQGIFGRSREV